MGWTYYRATHYTGKSHNIDRKAECDAYFLEGLNAGHYEVVKSRMVGRVYYAAVKHLVKYSGRDENGSAIYELIPENEQVTHGEVFITSVDNKDYFNFGYKDMSEDMGPYYYDCPESILKVLSPTDNKCALEWREKCWNTIQRKKTVPSLSQLPVGTVIEFDYNGRAVRLEKSAPAYQFKRPFWWNGVNYWPKTRIPENYKIIQA